MWTDFPNSFTWRFVRKFSMYISQKISTSPPNMLLHYLTVFGTRCVYIHSGHLWLGCKSANFINIVTGTHITRYLDNVLAVMWSYMSQVEVWHLLLVLPAVTGKSKSQLGFKLQFVHTWQFDLRYNDSVWNTVVRFVIWVANFSIVFEQ